MWKVAVAFVLIVLLGIGGSMFIDSRIEAKQDESRLLRRNPAVHLWVYDGVEYLIVTSGSGGVAIIEKNNRW